MGPEGSRHAARSRHAAADLDEVEAIAVCLLHAYADPTHERAVAARAAPPTPARARGRVARGGTGDPRVRARVDDGRRRLPRPGARRLPRTSWSASAAAAGLPEPLVMRSSGGVVTAGRGCGATRRGRCCRARPPAWSARPRRAARRLLGRDRVRHGWHLDRRLRSRRGRGVARERATGRRASRSGCRRSPCTPWAPVADRSCGATTAARSGSARRAPGAFPGPACYGRGGDRADGDRREPPPRDDCRRPLPGDLRARRRRRRTRAARASTRPPSSPWSTPRCSARCVSCRSEQGLDPRDFALVAFGGAGPLHACALAEELGRAHGARPAHAGVLAPLGLAACDERRDAVAGVVCPLEAAGELPREGEADLRYAGQSFELTVPLGADARGALPRLAREALRLRRPGDADRARRRADGTRSARGRAGAPAGTRARRAVGGPEWSSSTAPPAGCRRAGSGGRTPRHAPTSSGCA